MIFTEFNPPQTSMVPSNLEVKNNIYTLLSVVVLASLS